MASIRSKIVKVGMRRFMRPMVAKLTIAKIRANNENSGRFMPAPKGVVFEPVTANGVACEWTMPANPQPGRAILYLHGGGWVMGSPKTHRGMLGRLVMETQVKALSVDYRLAPEDPFPAALDDCLAAYHWLIEQGYEPGHIAVAGDSAGGNLALALLLALKQCGEPLPAGAVCFSPATDLASTGETYKSKADADPLLDVAAGRSWIEAYLNGLSPLDPLISPLYGDLHGLPPILIQVGTDEILLSDAERFAERACQAGVSLKLDVWPGMWHVFQLFGGLVPESGQAIRQAGEYIRGLIAP